MRVAITALLTVTCLCAWAQPQLRARPTLLHESFEGEMEGWRLVLNRGAEAAISVEEGGVLGDRCLCIAPERLCAPDDRELPTNIHLRYEELALRAGRTYRLCVWMRAESPRLVDFKVRRNSVEEAVHGRPLEVGTSWARHDFDFSPPTDYPDGVPQIVLARSLAPVYIDAITLVEIEAGDLAPADYLDIAEEVAGPRSSLVRFACHFDDEAHGWRLQLNRGASAEVSLDAEEGCLRVTPQALCAPNDEPYATNIHLRAAPVALRGGQEYVFSARLRSDGPRQAWLRVRAESGGAAAGGEPFDVDDRWRRFEWRFTLEEEMTAIPQVLAGADLRALWVDDVVLCEAGVGDEPPEGCVERGFCWLRPEVVAAGEAIGPLEGLTELAGDLPGPMRLMMAADMFGADALRVVLAGDGGALAIDVGAQVAVRRVAGDELTELLRETPADAPWRPGGPVTMMLERLGGAPRLVLGGTHELALPEEPFDRILIGAAKPEQPVRMLHVEGYEMLSTGRPEGSTEKKEYTDPVTGRRIVRLTHSPFNDKHTYYDISPWSPDGSLIAFSSALPGERDSALYIMDADGTNIRKVADGHGFSMHTGLFHAWAPDGRHLYFNTRWEDEDGEIVRGTALVDIATGEVERYADVGMRQVSWATGRLLWMENGRGDEDPVRGLYSAAPDGTDVTLLFRTEEIEALSPTREMHDRCARLGLTNCKWSPDGTKVMVVLVGYDAHGSQIVKEIYIADADGSDLHFVMTFAHHHIWHPNSRQVIGNCAAGLYIVNADGTGRRRICGLAQGHPSFSPDGSVIVTDCYGGEYADMLVLIDPETGEVEPLCSVPTVHGRSHETGTHPHPSWSPDGRSIIYDSDQEGHCQVYQVFVDG